MKKTFRFFAFAAAAVAMLSSCAKEAVVSNEEDTGKTFTVTAEYTEPVSDTKTAFVDGENPYVKWLPTDKIVVYESIDGEYKYHHDQDGDIILSDNGKVAKFNIDLYTPQGGAPTGTTFCYTAFYPADCVKEGNGFYCFEIPANQTLSEGCNFAAGSDVLIGKPVNMDSRISTTTNLEVQFKRPGTVVALTLKGITEGETISSVKITAPEGNYISGRSKVNRTTGEVYEKAYLGGGRSNIITLNCGDAAATGNDVFYFRCLDGTWTRGSEVSISVETDAATYTKTVNLPKDYVFADGGLTKFGFQGMMREQKDIPTTYTLVKPGDVIFDGATYIVVSRYTASDNSYYTIKDLNSGGYYNSCKICTKGTTSDSVLESIDVASTLSISAFKISKINANNYTLLNTTSNKYFRTNADNTGGIKEVETANSDKEKYTVTIDATTGIVTIKSIASGITRGLFSNISSSRFGLYASDQPNGKTYLYVDQSTCKEKVATPALAKGSAPAGEVNVGTVIKLTCATEDATIHYTTDGTKPTATSTQYTDAGITINDDCTIKAIAVRDEYSDSDVLTLEYTVKVVADPEISISGAGLATVTCGTESALIYYTVGTEPADPTSKSTLYEVAVQLTNGQTIKAIAYKDGMKPSAVADATFVSGSYDVTFTHEQEHGTVTVNDDETGTVKVEEGASVVIVAEPAANYHFVSWTITPEVEFTSGPATDATATFTMPASAVEVVAVFEKDPAVAPVVTYDFSKISFEGWTNTYANHVVEDDNATVTFTEASKQTGTITDIPVTKGSDITVVMKGSNVINSLTLLTKQWSDKKNTVTLHTSTDGGKTYTDTKITANQGTPLSASNLGDVNAVKFTFSSSSNQIGIAALSLNGGALPKEDASWSVDHISVKVDETKDVTISTNYTGTLKVESKDESKVTATISGKTITVKGISEGTTTLIVTGDAIDVYNAINKEVAVTVTAASSGDDPSKTATLSSISTKNVVGTKGGSVSHTFNDVTCTVVRNSGNQPGFYTSSGIVRYYSADVMTLSVPDNYVITKIEFTMESGTVGTASPTGLSTDSKTWTGSANSVSFTGGGTVKINSITVTYSAKSN